MKEETTSTTTTTTVEPRTTTKSRPFVITTEIISTTKNQTEEDSINTTTSKTKDARKWSINRLTSMTKPILANVTATVINATLFQNNASLTLTSALLAFLENETNSSIPFIDWRDKPTHVKHQKLSQLALIEQKKNNFKILITYLKKKKTMKNVVADIEQFERYQELEAKIKQSLMDIFKIALGEIIQQQFS